MAMRITIFEIPVEVKSGVVSLLKEYSLSFEINPTPHDQYIELWITHDKSQAYQIDLVEQKINSLAESIA